LEKLKYLHGKVGVSAENWIGQLPNISSILKFEPKDFVDVPKTKPGLDALTKSSRRSPVILLVLVI
jgi:hypothetical protein